MLEISEVLMLEWVTLINVALGDFGCLKIHTKGNH
jgi:hypothetical protein